MYFFACELRWMFENFLFRRFIVAVEGFSFLFEQVSNKAFNFFTINYVNFGMLALSSNLVCLHVNTYLRE